MYLEGNMKRPDLVGTGRRTINRGPTTPHTITTNSRGIQTTPQGVMVLPLVRTMQEDLHSTVAPLDLAALHQQVTIPLLILVTP